MTGARISVSHGTDLAKVVYAQLKGKGPGQPVKVLWRSDEPATSLFNFDVPQAAARFEIA